MRVITLDVVRATMEQMGSPADFGEPRDARAGRNANPPAGETGRTAAPRARLYRSRTERSIAGICGGLAAYFDADPTLIRLVTLLLILFGGLSIWAYIILWIVIPEEPARKFTHQPTTDNKTTNMATNDNKRLFRSQDSIIAGVCAGLAEYFGLDTSLVRIGTLILILFGGLSLWIYIILWLIVPKAPKRLNA